MANWQSQLDQLIRPAVRQSEATDELLIAPGATRQTGAVARRVTDKPRALIMADDAGFGAAGDAVVASLADAGFQTETLVLPSDPLPKAAVTTAEPFRARLAEDNELFPVSVGSGVINDLVKYAAFQTNQRYLTVATAASMDGYTSAGAPLAKEGFKVTIPTRAPIAMIADLDVLATAPAEMTGWGYADLSGKMPAGGDWIIADALNIEAIDDNAWPLVQNHLRGWLAGPAGILKGDIDAVARLFIGLTAVGFAMEFHGSSRPASGADHQIAHMWEMEDHSHNGRKVSHGAAVAVGCVAALSVYDWLIKQDLTQLDVDATLATAPDIDARLRTVRKDIPDPYVAAKSEQEVRAKHLGRVDHRARLELLVSVWPDIRSRLCSHLLRAEDMIGMLREANAPAFAHQIGVSPDHLLRTLRAAPHIRRRYTVFDLLHETGLTEQALKHVMPLLGPKRTEATE
ncbi:hypothetical protein GCM10007385_08620 [Tateyamaria omphalii]|uniref:iron-containing alcohol dehydrogenase n=1 Tax=Tateyamaria omphalii TaxID=299262 RepID=UPI001676D5EF|nr:iron-containing alcohol dehydrogenase [Tateyamaria omphalii]GGX43040.1 hypothetical protein GCM10007385_08620 [Tateyamaria omphalii]